MELLKKLEKIHQTLNLLEPSLLKDMLNREVSSIIKEIEIIK